MSIVRWLPSLRRGLAQLARCAGGLAAVLLLASQLAAPVHAARHALLVGMSKYEKEKGIDPLQIAANDADAVSKALQNPALNFKTQLLGNEDLRDKAAFEAAFERFLQRIQPGDDVLFYFSGHGWHVPDKGNFFLLADAKSPTTYFKDMGTGAKPFDTNDKREKEYREWVSRVALSEDAIIRAIEGRKAGFTVVIADASRNLLSDKSDKNAVKLASSVKLPQAAPRTVFRLYSAGINQISIDAPSHTSTTPSTRPEREAARKQSTTLFTRYLLSRIVRSDYELNILARAVKFDVSQEASRLGFDQTPDFIDDRQPLGFRFLDQPVDAGRTGLCQTAETEFAQLRFGVTHGLIGRQEIERKLFDLAPCGKAEQIALLLRLEAQGVGALSGTQSDMTIPDSAKDDPARLCEVLASSPLDANRAQGVDGIELQQVATEAQAGEIPRDRAIGLIERAIDACGIAVTERNRVARYKFNLARAHYAMAILAPVTDKPTHLEAASRHMGDAVDLGYAAAYNALGQMYQNGEVYITNGDKIEHIAADREIALKLLTSGANLNDVLANYNLGLAYKYGDNGVQLERKKAFPYLSAAAEAGFVPAMIEAARALNSGVGVTRNNKRAVELLEIAASRGSAEAMYLLGLMYRDVIIDTELEYTRDIVVADKTEAAIWFARAAEAGDTRAQAALAAVMQEGNGLPAPQPEAAGRYWRLAAEGGSASAQFELANRIRDGKIPFRPKVGGRPDGGAHEIRKLYESAYAKGQPQAGLELGYLYRSGFPRDGIGSVDIPKSPELAIDMFRDVMDAVKSASPDSAAANPEFEIKAAFQLVEMYDSGENKRRDGTQVITEDQIKQLKEYYNDPKQMMYVRIASVMQNGFACAYPSTNRMVTDPWVFVFNWKRPEPPTEMMFDWWERVTKCKEIKPGDTKTKAENLGILKRTREAFKREFEAAQKDKTSSKTFVDRIVELANKEKPKRNDE